MDLEKTSIILKKINRLHELISAIGEASSTETDLLKAYVVDLYEAVAMSDLADIEDLDEEGMRKKMKKQKKIAKKIKKQVVKKAIVEEVEDDDLEELYQEVDETLDILEEDEVEEVAVAEPVLQESAPAKSAKSAEAGFSPELIDLFDINESAELSDKLANSPIKDLTKAMGINEKIFTVNELFGGSQSEMDNMLLALNGLDSFEEAKSVLMRSVAQKNSWTDTSKIKKAKNFIRLVKRRFN